MYFGREKMKFIYFILLFFSINILYAQEITYLSKAGKTDYVIVIPKNPPKNVLKAANELKSFLKQITNADFDIQSDDSSLPSKAILLGSNRYIKDIDSTINTAAFEDDGFTIRTKNNYLIIIGGEKKGSLYGVYTFLENYLGCRWYTAKVSYIPKVDTLALKPISETQQPVIKFRDTFYKETNDSLFADRQKISHNAKGEHDEWGSWVHTMASLVPPDKYFTEHPEYYSYYNGKRHTSQLCLSNPDVLKIVIANLKLEIAKKPEAKYWSVSQNDNQNYCQCPVCKALDEIEGGPSGSIITFVNKVAAHFPDKIISTLAYQYSRSVPRLVRPAHNVNIMLCSIEADRSKPIEDVDSAGSFTKDLEAWSKITDNILVWDYAVQYRNLVSPFPNLQILQPNIKFFVKNKVKNIFEEGNPLTGGEFSELRAYLLAKLLWNPNADVDTVINDFLNGFYGKAGESIKKYIDLTYKELKKSGKDLYIYGYPTDHKDGFLSFELISKYNEFFDKAEDAVKDSAVLLQRVKEARMPLNFAMLEIARSEGANPYGIYTPYGDFEWTIKPEVEKRLYDFVSLCKSRGVEKLSETETTPDEYQKKMVRIYGFKPHAAYKKEVTLKYPPMAKFNGGGKNALTDGLRATTDYHNYWQGFDGNDLEATIDLGNVTEINKITAEFLNDAYSRIFLPQYVEFSFSLDGINFQQINKIVNVEPGKKGKFIDTFEGVAGHRKVRYIKVFAKSIGKCPEWHSFAGYNARIFSDEIIVE